MRTFARTTLAVALAAPLTLITLTSPAQASTATSARDAIANACPTVVTADALSNVGADFDVHAQCVSAVHAARNTTAAKAVVYAFIKLGAPTLCLSISDFYKKREAGTAFDTSSLVLHAYKNAGMNISVNGSTRDIMGWDGVKQATWVKNLAAESKARPGDLNGYRFGKLIRHLTIHVGDGLFIQADGSCDGVVELIRPAASWKKSYVASYQMLPGKAR